MQQLALYPSLPEWDHIYLSVLLKNDNSVFQKNDKTGREGQGAGVRTSYFCNCSVTLYLMHFH